MRAGVPMLALFAILCLTWLLRSSMAQEGEPGNVPSAPGFEAFPLEELRARARDAGRPYLPFLDRPTLSCGLYRLKAGSRDGQSPHDQDEVYYVLSGRGKFRAGDEAQVVQEGDTLFVGADVEHRFFEIEQDLELLVFFSKKEVE